MKGFLRLFPWLLYATDPRWTRMAGRLFPRNTHQAERWIHILLGVGLLSLTVPGPSTPWGFLGLVPLATGLAGSFPMYTLFGISRCRAKAR